MVLKYALKYDICARRVSNVHRIASSVGGNRAVVFYSHICYRVSSCFWHLLRNSTSFHMIVLCPISLPSPMMLNEEFLLSVGQSSKSEVGNLINLKHVNDTFNMFTHTANVKSCPQEVDTAGIASDSIPTSRALFHI